MSDGRDGPDSLNVFERQVLVENLHSYALFEFSGNAVIWLL